MGEELKSYIEAQRLKGADDTVIKEALLGAGWSTTAVDSAFAGKILIDNPPLPPVDTAPPPRVLPTNAENQATNPSVSQSIHSHLNASQALLVLGLVLIVVAATVIVFYSWDSFPPFVRFLAAAIPNVLLFVVGYFVKRQQTLAHIDEGTNAVALLLLPVTIGTFYYQFGIIPKIDSYLFFLSTATALPIMVAFDFWRRQSFAAVLTVITLCASILFLGAYQGWEMRTWLWVEFVFAVVTLAISVLADRAKDNNHTQPYQVISAIAFFFSVPLLWGDVIGIYNGIGDSPAPQVLFAFAAGLTSLLIGSFYGWLFTNKTSVEYQLQRFIQFGAIASMLLPLIALVSDQSTFVVLAIITSAAMAVFAMFVGVNMIFMMGAIGVVISLLTVLFKELTNIATPILLFVLGFVAIGISIFLGRLKVARKSFYSANVASSLGIISDEQSEQLTTNKQSYKFSPGMIILLLILLWLGYSLFATMGGLYSLSRPQKSTDTPALVTTTDYDRPSSVTSNSSEEATTSSMCDATAASSNMTGYKFKDVTYYRPVNWSIYTNSPNAKVGYYVNGGSGGYSSACHFDIILAPSASVNTDSLTFLESYYGLSVIATSPDVQSAGGYKLAHYEGMIKPALNQNGAVDILILTNNADSYMFSIDYQSVEKDPLLYERFLRVIDTVQLSPTS